MHGSADSEPSRSQIPAGNGHDSALATAPQVSNEATLRGAGAEQPRRLRSNHPKASGRKRHPLQLEARANRI